MKRLICFITIFICFSCNHNSKKMEGNDAKSNQMDYWRHLSYLFQIKNEVANESWKEFSEDALFQPIIYYTHEGTFALNPNEHILHNSQYEKLKPHNDVELIKLSETYTDTTNFNFYSSYSDSDSTALYYQENVLFFQSFNLTKELIGINDLQDWSIMVIHELFHGYQRMIPEFKNYCTQLEIPGGPDVFLGSYHKEIDWFKESVYNENELLKAIWIHDADLVDNLNKYDALRTRRIERIKDSFGIDIREIEDYEILMEGQARYFESLCKRYLAKNNTDTSMLEKEDINLISNMFQGYDIKKDKGLFDIYNDRYYYQLGYNISMILEKHLPEYRESIYIEENNFNRYIEILIARDDMYK